MITSSGSNHTPVSEGMEGVRWGAAYRALVRKIFKKTGCSTIDEERALQREKSRNLVPMIPTVAGDFVVHRAYGAQKQLTLIVGQMLKIRYDLERRVSSHDSVKNFFVIGCLNQPTPSIGASSSFLYRFGFEQGYHVRVGLTLRR
jgi:hypothetical protein